MFGDTTQRHQVELGRVGNAIGYWRAQAHPGQIDRNDVILLVVCQVRRDWLEAIRIIKKPVESEYGLADAQRAENLPAYLSPAALNLKLCRFAW